MKCPRCGTELAKGYGRCSGCGLKIKGVDGEVKAGGIGLYSVFFIVSVVLFLGMITAALCFEKKASCVFAALSLVLIVASYVIGKKAMILWLSRLCIPLAVISYLLIFPYISMFSVVETDTPKFSWDEIILKNVIPKPDSEYGNIYVNSDEKLEIHIYKINSYKYSKHIKRCEEKGFDVDKIKEDESFLAYNEEGYNLNIEYDKKYRKMEIRLQTPIELTEINWAEFDIFNIIPKPESVSGKIEENSENIFSAYIGKTTYDDFNSYISRCENAGFTSEALKENKKFFGINENKYKLTVEYLGGNLIYLRVEIPTYSINIGVECEENLFFSKFDVDVILDGEKLSTISHGSADEYNLSLKRGEYKLKFVSCDDESVTGETTLFVNKDASYKFRIKCSIFGINVSSQK